MVDPASRRLLEATGWTLPSPEGLPTGTELVEQYLEPLAALEPIASRIRTRRDGRRRHPRRAWTAPAPRAARRRRSCCASHTVDGVEELTARAVIDASGTYDAPRTASASSGLDPLGLPEVADRGQPRPSRRARARPRTVRAAGTRTVVGAGHSAANTLLALAELAEHGTGHPHHLG